MDKSLMIFAYDFPNYKTEIIIRTLAKEGFDIKYVIGAPKVVLNRPVSELPDTSGLVSSIQTKTLCEDLGIPYYVFPHNSFECEKFLKNNPVPVGIIAGAQIIKKNIIECFSLGIINTHEGLLPWIRGLDTLKWSVYTGLPMANSIHFISDKIDQGKLIYVEKTEIKPEDRIIDVGNRMISSKPEVLVRALNILQDKLRTNIDLRVFPRLDVKGGIYGKIMSLDFSKKNYSKFAEWKKNNIGPAKEINPFSEPYKSIGESTIETDKKFLK